MRKKRSWHIGLTLLLVGLVLAGLLPVRGIAQNEREKELIIAFDVPVTEIIVPLGTEGTDIPLPETLAATLEGGAAADIPVTWDVSGVYSKDEAGTYLFTADIGAYLYAQARPVSVVTVASESELSPGSRISGCLWLDENADGVMEDGENGVAGYLISLYPADDKSVAIQETRTQEDGTYLFDSIEPGSYVVGITSETIGETEYLLPLAGITGDNKFNTVLVDEENAAAYSETVVIPEGVDTAAENINAGLRLGITMSPLAAGIFVNLPLGGNVLAGGDMGKLVVMEADGDPLSGYYQAYTADESGLRSALLGLYQRNQENSDYIMYVGSNITNLPGNIFHNTVSATGTGDVTFASLRGRLNTLVLTGSQEDSVTDTAAMSAPSDVSLFTVSGTGERNFGCNIILRNIRHTFNAGDTGTQGVYMNGYALTLGGNSWQMAATRYFGGGSTGSVTPSEEAASITVYSTGTGFSAFIGGMRTGTLNGNASVTIYDTSGNTFSIRGGGLGASASAPANITGSVTNRITNMATGSGGLERFLGGVEYGTVEGSITNEISGNGRFSSVDAGYVWTAGTSRIVGGSLYGNVGSDATLGGAVDTSDLSGLVYTSDYVIKNNIDTSNFTYGRVCYLGTNYQSGVVKGNVVNLVRAGADNRGSLSVFSGGAGHYAAIGSSWQSSFTVNSSNAKVTNVEAGLDAAKAAARYQLYGNITNVIYEGSICYSGDNEHWFRGAGWGYMEGNAYSEVGTEGIAYLGSYNSYSYSTTNTSQGFVTGFDLVGGGGTISSNNSFCIKGDTTLVTKNVLARWTYGGSFGGVQVGNSVRIHHGGVVDTCEGTGYNSYIHVGDGRAEVHGGQVDWFLSGGGWNDTYQDGNVSVEVFDKPDVYINASMGGTYGSTTAHYISGDAAIVVHGGNFSGTARTAVLRGFSAGPSYAGYIYGNASVTVDLRGNQYGFSIEPGDSISGGRRLNAESISYLGTNADNTITLNVLTDDSQTDLLNGLNIYGDCSVAAGSADNTRAGHIIINVNAPKAVIGNLYATSYANVSGGILKRDVQVNLVSAGTITGLCAGNGTENITNSVASASGGAGKKAVINVGPQSEDPSNILGDREPAQTSDGLPHRIQISTKGITGFTSMDIRKRLLVAQNGNIKNGLNATVSNHGTSYHSFGDVTLHAGEGMEGAGLGIASASASFIAGTAYVEGKGQVYVQSSGQADQIVFTDIITNENNALTWMKVGNAGADTNLQTNWFGVNSGWRVITLNPDKTKAKDRITPVNFRGFEEATGRTFIGDSDTHFSGNNGYAVAILGSVYNWEVTEGHGKIYHNVPVATTAPSSGQGVSAYGTVPANTPSVSGAIAIPSALIPGTVPYPVFSFVPDSYRGEWVEAVDIYGSDQYISSSPHNYHIDPGEAGQTKNWTASGDDKDYSFHIRAQFAQGNTQVSAVDVIITESEAAAINSAADIISYTQASGSPLFQNNITAQMLEEIRMPLGQDQIWRTHTVSYTAGDEALTGSQVHKDAYVTVVKDGTAVSAGRQYALYANDGVMTLEQAQGISSQIALDSGYTNAVAILADGTSVVPAIDNGALPAIISSTAATVPKDVPVTYTYAPDGQSQAVTKQVTVHIGGPNEIKVTISKIAAGDYADRTREFSFTIYLSDNSGAALPGGTQLLYTGGSVSGLDAEAPPGGTMTLDEEGKAIFKLKHGQLITVGVPVPQGYVRIVESDDPNYSVSFTDNGTLSPPNSPDTGLVSLAGADRTFDFTNTRYGAVPTGVLMGSVQGPVLLGASMLLLLGLVGAGMIRYPWKRRQ
ncbi:SdrD B-like domain-containing protein [Lacrimispora brassicae]